MFSMDDLYDESEVSAAPAVQLRIKKRSSSTTDLRKSISRSTSDLRKSIINRRSKDYATMETKASRNSMIYETISYDNEDNISQVDGNCAGKNLNMIEQPIQKAEIKIVSEKKSSKILKLIGMRKSSSSDSKSIPNQKSKHVSSEFYVDVIHSGVLLERMKSGDSFECKVSLDHHHIRWNSERKKDIVQIQNITSIMAINNGDVEWGYGMELAVASTSSEQNQQVLIFSARSHDSRSIWMKHLLELTAPAMFPKNLSADFIRAGQVSMKDGIAGDRVWGWLMLQHREIFFCVNNSSVLIPGDLRLARRVVSQREEGGSSVLLDFFDRSMYVRSTSESETVRWWFCLRDAARNNGDHLEQQQLTRHLVPVIVDICTDFVTVYGGSTEGIYSGEDVNLTIVNRLLTDFRLKDARELHLGSYPPLDVAQALMRFFSELPTPLFSLDTVSKFADILQGSLNYEEKAIQYRTVLERHLNEVSMATSRKLLGHLHLLNLQSDENKMNATKLAEVWCPCLMNSNPMTIECEKSVLEDLIRLYPLVFRLSDEEMERELRMLEVTKQMKFDTRLHRQSSSVNVWVSIGEYYSQDAVRIVAGPNTTAIEVCRELNRGCDMMLQEFVLGGSLFRPLHPNEKVLEVVMKWTNWDEKDRIDNQLVLAPSHFYQEMRAQGKARARTAGELKFCDANSRHYVSCEVELDQTILSCFRDYKKTSKLGEWRIDDLSWYVGQDHTKRELFSKWAITFINKRENPRTRDYFGYVIGGSNMQELFYWGAGFMLAQYAGYL